MAYTSLGFEFTAGIGRLTIQRPEALNALNAQLLRELTELCSELRTKAGLRALIITGSGEKAFVAGADIKEMMSMTAPEGEAFARLGQEAFSAIEALPLPVIAAVNGFALGGGLELALACDIILASEKAKFGLPEVTLGLLPAFGGTQRLARAVGLYKAREIVYSGEFFGAEQGRAIGLVNQVYPPEQLLSQATRLAETIAKRGPLAVRGAKEVMNRGFDLRLDEGLKLEAAAFGSLFTSQDQKEGTAAFVEKRPATFVGA